MSARGQALPDPLSVRIPPERRLISIRVLGPSGTIGAALSVLVVLTVMLGPMIWTLSPTAQDLSQALHGISATHPLGTDQFGRDLLARTLSGGLISLSIGLFSVVIGVFLGVIIGMISILFGGWVEAVLMRLIDALLAIPGIVQALILVAIIGRGIVPLVVALGIYTVPIFARISQQTGRQLLQLDYVAASRALGAGPVRLALVHVLPGLWTSIITIASFRVGANLLTGAALNFFGLGAQPPVAEWGLMIAEGQRYAWQHPMVTFAPGLALIVTTLGLNLLGDGIRHRLDPKSRS